MGTCIQWKTTRLPESELRSCHLYSHRLWDNRLKIGTLKMLLGWIETWIYVKSQAEVDSLGVFRFVLFFTTDANDSSVSMPTSLEGSFFHFIWQERPQILYSTPTSTVSFNNNNNNNCFTVNAEQSANSSQETRLTLILKWILSVDINVKKYIKTVAQRATFEIFFWESERTSNNPNSSPVPIGVCQRTTSTCLCNK